VNGIKHWWSRDPKIGYLHEAFSSKTQIFAHCSMKASMVLAGPSQSHSYTFGCPPLKLLHTIDAHWLFCHLPYFNQWVCFMIELKPSWRLEFNNADYVQYFCRLFTSDPNFLAEGALTYYVWIFSRRVIDFSCLVNLNSLKQASASPPNFIHSLDMTHVMLTADFMWGNQGVQFMIPTPALFYWNFTITRKTVILLTLWHQVFVLHFKW
jgi:hypothetical protein